MSSDVYNSQGNVDFLSALMQDMKMMKTEMKKQAEQIEDLNAKVSRLEEENATLRSQLNEAEKTGTEQLNHLKEENELLRNQLDESKKKETGQPQSEKTSIKRPENSRLISSIEELDESIDSRAHVAIRRAHGEFNEFSIRRTNPKDGEKENYKFLKEQKSSGETENIDIEEIKQAIADGNCFVIEDPWHLKTSQEEDCFVIEDPCHLKTSPEEDCFVIEDPCHLKTSQEEEAPLGNKLRASGCSLATTMVSSFEGEATNAVVNEASKSLKWYIPPSSAKEAHVCMHTKTICKNASQKLGNRGSLSKILKHKKTSSVAKTASKESLKKSAFSNLLITGGIEGAIAVYDLHQLSKKNLSEKDYNREFKRTVSGAVGATVGSVGAGMVGQVLCPIPVLGFAFGSMIGNYGGRLFASKMVS